MANDSSSGPASGIAWNYDGNDFGDGSGSRRARVSGQTTATGRPTKRVFDTGPKVRESRLSTELSPRTKNSPGPRGSAVRMPCPPSSGDDV